MKKPIKLPRILSTLSKFVKFLTYPSKIDNCSFLQHRYNEGEFKKTEFFVLKKSEKTSVLVDEKHDRLELV